MSLIKGITVRGDKESTKSTGNAQAYTDTATRNNQEDRYYKLKESKQKKGISELDFSYLKRYYSGNKTKAENAVLEQSASTLRGYINAQKKKASNANTKLNSQGNVVITQAELASMSPQAAEALLQDSQISVAAPGQNRVTITQEELASMSPQMAEAMLNDPLVTLADGNGGGSNTSGQNIVTITQAELASMSSQAAEAILSDPNVQLVGSSGSGSSTSVQMSGQDIITNALNDINSMSGPNSILAAQDPYRILDSAEKEASFKSAKRDKNISDDDFKWLLVLTKGDENKAKEHVIKLTASHLRSLIITQKNFAGYEDSLLGGGDTGISIGRNKGWFVETIEDAINDASDFVEDSMDSIDLFVDYFKEDSIYVDEVIKVNEAWDEAYEKIIANDYSVYDMEDMRYWSKEKIELEQAREDLREINSAIAESQIIWTERDSAYRTKLEEVQGAWQKYGLQKYAAVAKLGINITKIISGGSIVEAVINEVLSKFVDKAIDDLLDELIKRVSRLIDVEPAKMKEIRDLIPSFAALDEEKWRIKNLEKELSDLKNAFLSIDEIHKNNLKSKEALEDKISKLKNKIN